jgi:hypothetical protein
MIMTAYIALVPGVTPPEAKGCPSSSAKRMKRTDKGEEEKSPLFSL